MKIKIHYAHTENGWTCYDSFDWSFIGPLNPDHIVDLALDYLLNAGYDVWSVSVGG